MQDGGCATVIALNIEDNTLSALICRGSCWRLVGVFQLTCTSAHVCTEDGNDMVMMVGLPLQGFGFVQLHRTGIYGA
jgi:succinate dehydrogenase / fumarate reductase flavoprotein subunit